MASSNSNNEKKDGLKKIYEFKRKCRYCGVIRPQFDMTSLPKNKEQLSAWIEILGPQFAENIKTSKTNYICMSHIENEERGHYRLPKNLNNITLVNSKPKVKQVSRQGSMKCRYCGISCSHLDMTSIPTNPIQLSKWIKILGPEFAEKIKRFKSNWICLDHIENRDRGNYRLPKKFNDKSAMITDDDNHEIDTEQAQKTMENDNLRKSGRVLKNTVNGSTSSEEEVEESDDEVYKQNEKIEKNNNRRSERVAKRERIDYTFEIEETDEGDEEIIKEHNQGIEDDDEEYTEMEPHGPISEVVGSKTNEMEIQNHSNSAITNLEMEEEDRDIVEMVPPKREMVENVIEIKTNNQLNFEGENLVDGLIQCRVFNKYFNKNSMTETPTDPKKLQKWIGVLGSEFFGNIIQNLPPYFICVDDLRKIVDQLFEEEHQAAEL